MSGLGAAESDCTPGEAAAGLFASERVRRRLGLVHIWDGSAGGWYSQRESALVAVAQVVAAWGY